MALTVLDTSVLISLLDSKDPGHQRATAAFLAAGGTDLVLPATVLAEALVGPYRKGADALKAAERALSELAPRIEPIGESAARRAAEIRSRHPTLRLPDALVLAVGDVMQAQSVWTGERGWARISPRVRVI